MCSPDFFPNSRISSLKQDKSGRANFLINPFQIGLIAISDGLIVSRTVGKSFRVIAITGLVFFFQIELAGVSGKPEIELQFFHCIQRIGIILLELGIGLGARQFPYHKIAAIRNGLYSCTQDGLKLGSGMSV